MLHRRNIETPQQKAANQSHHSGKVWSTRLNHHVQLYIMHIGSNELAFTFLEEVTLCA